MSEKPLVVFVLGPTATGKTEIAVQASEAAAREGLKSEILCCDSIQFYDGLDIGAAKPTREQMERAPHHLVGHVTTGMVYTAGDFRRDALRVIAERAKAGVRLFLAVGGSGFYVQALEKGMFDVPQVPEETRRGLEKELAAGGLEALYGELAARDPEAASKIKPQDSYRTLRALELLRADPEGLTLTERRAQFEAKREPAPFEIRKIGLSVPRETLAHRVARRTKAMLAEGLIAEVEGLRSRGLGEWAPMNSVGYKETQALLDGRLDRASLEGAIVTSTMQLAKRQMTWFKRDTEIRWFDAERESAAARDLILECFRSGVPTVKP